MSLCCCEKCFYAGRFCLYICPVATDIRKYAFRPSAQPQIEVVPLEQLTAASSPYLVVPHRTEFYHVFLFEDCHPTHTVDFNAIGIRPFSLLFIDKERVHQFDRLLKYTGCVLVFTDSFFCTTDSDARFLRSSILFNGINDNGVLQPGKAVFDNCMSICSQISSELQQETDAGQPFILKNYLHNFLLLAEREKRKQGFSGSSKGPDLEYAVLFKDLLDQHFTDKKQVSFYAGKLHVSEKRLGQATAKISGRTPKELISDRILLEAKRLLVHGSQSVKEIGFALGFEEPTNFIKFFRKLAGQTPALFRDSQLPRIRS